MSRARSLISLNYIELSLVDDSIDHCSLRTGNGLKRNGLGGGSIDNDLIVLTIVGCLGKSVLGAVYSNLGSVCLVLSNSDNNGVNVVCNSEGKS